MIYRPCPMCGSQPTPYWSRLEPGTFSLRCDACGGAMTRNFPTLKEAEDAWNQMPRGQE